MPNILQSKTLCGYTHHGKIRTRSTKIGRFDSCVVAHLYSGIDFRLCGDDNVRRWGRDLYGSFRLPELVRLQTDNKYTENRTQNDEPGFRRMVVLYES